MLRPSWPGPDARRPSSSSNPSRAAARTRGAPSAGISNPSPRARAPIRSTPLSAGRRQRNRLQSAALALSSPAKSSNASSALSPRRGRFPPSASLWRRGGGRRRCSKRVAARRGCDLTVAIGLAAAWGGAVGAGGGGAVFFDASACRTAKALSDRECQTAYVNAKAEFDEKAPRFVSRAECERYFRRCMIGDIDSGGRRVAFIPQMRGFRSRTARAAGRPGRRGRRRRRLFQPRAVGRPDASVSAAGGRRRSGLEGDDRRADAVARRSATRRRARPPSARPRLSVVAGYVAGSAEPRARVRRPARSLAPPAHGGFGSRCAGDEKPPLLALQRQAGEARGGEGAGVDVDAVGADLRARPPACDRGRRSCRTAVRSDRKPSRIHSRSSALWRASGRPGRTPAWQKK